MDHSISPEPARSTPVVVCADDFGVDQGVNQAIVELARAGRLSATSVLVDAPYAQAATQALAGLPIDLGLHLNMTEVVGDLSSKDVLSLPSLILRTHARLVDLPWVRRVISRQLDRFEDLLGRVPDYVDGHLHVHQLPVVRDVLMAELKRRYPADALWVRDTRAARGSTQGWPVRDRFKTWMIGRLGMPTLARQAQVLGYQTNRGFLGVYDFTQPHAAYETMMQQWLSCSVPGSLIMTHPSTTLLAGDPIGEQRVQEFNFLLGGSFGALLQSLDVSVKRLSEIKSSLP